MNKPNEQDVMEEIAALRALLQTKPRELIANADVIDVIIETLEDGMDTTADEFLELTAAQQGAAKCVLKWLAGAARHRPTETLE